MITWILNAFTFYTIELIFILSSLMVWNAIHGLIWAEVPIILFVGLCFWFLYCYIVTGTAVG